MSSSEQEPAIRSLTENQSLTFANSGDPRIDFFFNVIQGATLEKTHDLLEKSWKAHPLDTMKLVMNCRDIRGGKGIRAQFLICLRWLLENQFDTLMLNLPHFATFGCWKDLLNLLLIAIFEELPYDSSTSREKTYFISKFDTQIIQSLTKEQRREFEQTKTKIYSVTEKRIVNDYSDMEKTKTSMLVTKVTAKTCDPELLKYKTLDKLFAPEISDQDHSCEMFYTVKTGQEKLKKLNQLRRNHFKKAYDTNEKFRVMYDRVVEMFAHQMVQDYQNFVKKELKNISLAAKWIPNPGRYFDKYLFILLPIAKKFFDLEGKLIMEIEPEEKRKVDKVLIRKFEKVYTVLRRNCLKIPEITMSAGDWQNLLYNNVTSKAMLKYKAAFIRNDQENFQKFISEKPLKGGALTPGDLVKAVTKIIFKEDVFSEPQDRITSDKQIELDVIQKQWESLIEDVRNKGDLMIKQSLAVCDVSQSMMMSTQSVCPIHAAIGLTLFLQHISNPPWNNYCISFSERPILHNITLAETLKDQVNRILSMDFGFNTDLNLVFDLILNEGKRKAIKDEDMPKVLFIFTDMEFDVAMQEKTNFEVCQMQYREAGYTLPLVVFWNLKGEKQNRSTPVRSVQEGVFLLSGYSAQTLNFFYTDSDLKQMTPLMMVLKIINDPRYSCVQIAQ